MKKAIVFYSKTGNTRLVAERLKEAFDHKNELVDLLEIKTKSDDPMQTEVEFVNQPDISNYDHVVLASPVHAFQPSKIIQAYIKTLNHVENKTFDLFITHHFPFAWLGGNGSLRKMKKMLENIKATVNLRISVNWSSKKREQVIQSLLEQFTSES
jgi:flavodoxin